MITETNAGRILRFLAKHPGAYGLQIMRGCHQNVRGIYTVLRRMERTGMITAKWGDSKLRARRKHYTIRRPR